MDELTKRTTIHILNLLLLKNKDPKAHLKGKLNLNAFYTVFQLKNIFCMVGNGNQIFIHSRKVLCHLAMTPA